MFTLRPSPCERAPPLARDQGSLARSPIPIIRLADSAWAAHGHRGIRSLGFVVSLGLVLTLLACWTVMPAWLVLTQRIRAKRDMK